MLACGASVLFTSGRIKEEGKKRDWHFVFFFFLCVYGHTIFCFMLDNYTHKRTRFPLSLIFLFSLLRLVVPVFSLLLCFQNDHHGRTTHEFTSSK